ncbi:hypothetical protein ACVNHR_005350, partial [Escherichia coli]
TSKICNIFSSDLLARILDSVSFTYGNSFKNEVNGMHSQDPITKLTQTLQRDDGSQVRIVAQRGYGSGLTASLDVYVLRRDSSESNWSLCGKDPHPEWRKMSVDEYQKFGRSEMLRYATPGEILRVASAIGQPMSFLDGNPAF